MEKPFLPLYTVPQDCRYNFSFGETVGGYRIVFERADRVNVKVDNLRGSREIWVWYGFSGEVSSFMAKYTLDGRLSELHFNLETLIETVPKTSRDYPQSLVEIGVGMDYAETSYNFGVEIDTREPWLGKAAAFLVKSVSGEAVQESVTVLDEFNGCEIEVDGSKVNVRVADKGSEIMVEMITTTGERYRWWLAKKVDTDCIDPAAADTSFHIAKAFGPVACRMETVLD